MPRVRVLTRIVITGWVRVTQGLNLEATRPARLSPYNPPVRLLQEELAQYGRTDLDQVDFYFKCIHLPFFCSFLATRLTPPRPLCLLCLLLANVDALHCPSRSLPYSVTSPQATETSAVQGELESAEVLTPTTARFTFRLSESVQQVPGPSYVNPIDLHKYYFYKTSVTSASVEQPSWRNSPFACLSPCSKGPIDTLQRKFRRFSHIFTPDQVR
jgi:hypothetical protein